VLHCQTNKKTDRVSETDIAKLLQGVDDDSDSYDAFVNVWNSLFSLNKQGEVSAFADIEAAALSSVASKKDVDLNFKVGFCVEYLLEQFDSPVIPCNIRFLQQYLSGSSKFCDDSPLMFSLLNQ